jgi:hypothetical protein
MYNTNNLNKYLMIIVMDITGGLSWRAFEEPLFCCIAGCCVISGMHCKVWDYLWERETSTGIVVRREFCMTRQSTTGRSSKKQSTTAMSTMDVEKQACGAVVTQWIGHAVTSIFQIMS